MSDFKAEYSQKMTDAFALLADAQLLMAKEIAAQVSKNGGTAAVAAPVKSTPVKPSKAKVAVAAPPKASASKVEDEASDEEAPAAAGKWKCQCHVFRDGEACPNPSSGQAKQKTQVPKDPSNPEGTKKKVELSDACRKEYLKKDKPKRARPSKDAAAAPAGAAEGQKKKAKVAPAPVVKKSEEEDEEQQQEEEEEEEQIEMYAEDEGDDMENL
jgi:hypothetical protein